MKSSLQSTGATFCSIPPTGVRSIERVVKEKLHPSDRPNSKNSLGDSPGNHGNPPVASNRPGITELESSLTTNHGVANGNCVDSLLLHSRLSLVGLTTTILANHGSI